MNNIKEDLSDDPRCRITPVQQIAAACSGALITSALVTPLDVVKIRLQVQHRPVNKCFVYCNGLMDHLCPCVTDSAQQPHSSNWYNRPGKFTGTIDAFVKISRAEGLSSLWSGLSPTLILAVPSTVIYFVSYEQLRVRLNERIKATTNSQPFWVPLTAGGTARIWAASVVSPLELVRTKMQSQKLSYLELGSAIRSLVVHEGVLGLWKGLGPTLLRDVPFSALYWLHYEWFKAWIVSRGGEFTTSHSFLGGALAGSVAAFVTTPFDVVKTHQQIELGENLISQEPTKKLHQRSTIHVLRQVYGAGGLPAVFAGLTPRLVKVAPACAIMVSSFEYGKSFFQRRNRQSSVLRGLDTHSRYALVIYHGPTSLVLAITMWKMQVIKPIAELKNKYWTQQLREKIE